MKEVAKGKKRNWFLRLLDIRETMVLLIIIIISVLLSLASPFFLTADNLRTTAIGLSADGIIVIGMTIALISGGFDLSVGSMVGLSGAIVAAMFVSGINIWMGVIVAIVICGALGLVSGLFIGKVGINPFIITLAMMSIARGCAYVITSGSPISLKNASESFLSLGRGEVLGIPVMVIIFIAFVVVGDILLRKSSPLRKVFYTGSNEKAAILSGINTKRVKVLVYFSSALLAAFAGVLSLARFGVATPTSGDGTEMRVISAAIIGGTSLNGGEGSVFGAVLGIILLNIISNALVLLKISVYWQELISGLILLLAVTIDFINHKRKASHLVVAE
ncbi:ABC transporter permease [Christensenella timonensis]|uniref:ABC transporter permease n=1 Tax=Christensenella timonensis TaxID=1816678 RepID=UPI000834A2BD|nr:ABC transporter permease [Christensenella timonensis]